MPDKTRKDHSKQLVSKLENLGSMEHSTFLFLDEKDFDQEQIANRHNER